VVLTNQGAVSLKSDPKTLKRDQKNLAAFKGKVTASLNQLDLPISVYAATIRDEYRKPRTGMWNEMLGDYDLDSDLLDLGESFFVGDAAGRPAVDGGSQDFSCSDRSVSLSLLYFPRPLLSYLPDRNFAANIGIQFHTPEELFLNEPPKSFTRDFDPAMYLNKPGLSPTTSSKFGSPSPVTLRLTGLALRLNRNTKT
jgi:bifunctional polynucleotide phosphatase/kinase